MEIQQHICVIGAGPAGFALAADLISQGKQVLLYSHPTHMRQASAVISNGGLEISGAIEGFVRIPITTDIAEALAFSQVAFLTVPSTGQETILQEMEGYDLRHHTLIAIPGNLLSLIKKANVEVGNILETNLSPYSCRMDGGRLIVLGRKKRVMIAALHNDGDQGPGATAQFRAAVQDLFPAGVALQWCHNVVEACLANVNGVFHPIMMLMNAGRIESTGGDFLLYRDGLTPAVARAMLAIDGVRVAIGAALGLLVPSTLDVSNACYGQDFAALETLAERSPPHNRLRAPAEFAAHRNVSEDVPDLLVPWCALAEALGIDASPVAAVVLLAEMSTGVDFMETGRNLKKLKLDALSRGELVAKFSPPVARYESRL
ncbi:hypothetical protein MCOR29_001945 [Pyricularia oryzae]|nr:hypothetical protein MCOR19_001729 [Pyricularia oryzae]KAI6330391.1 hypothetical protein MCOR29_001945 [Pyricularia oryzae]KAI6341093.1 hypothetical protein MCOR30_002316 [Pyricularia oryzae]KAI6481079.1 hypothetical protein MCOR18_004886 [Pyricularia oryzae]KAI6640982.1 hypothetical protein MCOR08_001312 [Pyricularia oryzae]